MTRLLLLLLFLVIGPFALAEAACLNLVTLLFVLEHRLFLSTRLISREDFILGLLLRHILLFFKTRE